jgi:hypothetical protein
VLINEIKIEEEVKEKYLPIQRFRRGEPGV